ncbi:MAG: undecaprenyldiphospho-muramoylpentapeptide beta-N-acetylglucosaminyltransferase [Parahaliea sp.]
MSRQMKILVMAGGTGGHIYPALAVAKELMARGHHIEWVGARHGMESKVVPAAGIELHFLSVRGVRGKHRLQSLLGLLRLLFSCLQALVLVWRQRPDCVMGMGGYAAGPAGLAAWLLRKPLLIHEQNAIAGTTNRLLAPLAKVVAAGFAGAFGERAGVRVLGNPVRQDFVSIAAEQPWQYQPERALHLLVVGGSLGAQAINEVLPTMISKVQTQGGGLQVIIRHQSGTAHAEQVSRAYEQAGINSKTVTVLPFIDDMAAAYGWADLVICRAGALTVAELAVSGRPAILIPLPQAIDNHQYWNARSLSDCGGGLLLEQKDLSADSLYQLLCGVLAQPDKLAAMSDAALKLAKPDATADVASCCEELCHV